MRLRVALIIGSTATFVACSPGFDSRPKSHADAPGPTVSTIESADDPSTIRATEAPLLLPPQFKPAPPRTRYESPRVDLPPDDIVPDSDFPSEDPAPAQPAELSSSRIEPSPPPQDPASLQNPSLPQPVIPNSPVPQPQPEAVEPQEAPVARPQPTVNETKSVVVCEKHERASCPSAVGVLLVRTANWNGQCTVSLIGDRFAITNSHCLPHAIRKAGSDCSRSLRLVFPKTPTHGYEHVACAEVISASQIANEGETDYAREADFAILMLARSVNRLAFKVNREGLPADMQLVAYTVDPAAKAQSVSVLKAKRCDARFGTTLATSFNQKFAAVGAFAKCEIIQGNSGSPAIDRFGNLRALVHGLRPPEPMPGGHRNFRHMALLTNFACIDVPGAIGENAGTAHADCSKKITPEQLVQGLHDKANDAESRALGEAWLKTAPHQFQFEIRRSESRGSPIRLFAPQIVCVRNARSLVAAQSAKQETNVQVTLPFWGFKVEVTEEYQVRLAPGIHNEVELDLTFDARALSRNGSVSARAIAKNKTTGESRVVPGFGLRVCR